MIHDKSFNAKLEFNLLYEVGGGYHILPSSTISQDTNMYRFQVGTGCKTQWLYQKDGSRFKTLHFRKSLELYDIVYFLSKEFGIHNLIHEGVKVTDKSDLEDILANRGLVKNAGGCRMIVYWTHTFINGYRVIPLLVDIETQRFYNVSRVFPEFIPEDDFGLLLEDLSSIEFKGVSVEDMEVISYLSTIRMCPKCGIVSNIGKPKKYPWLYYANTAKHHEQTERSLGNNIFVKKAALSRKLL